MSWKIRAPRGTLRGRDPILRPRWGTIKTRFASWDSFRRLATGYAVAAGAVSAAAGIAVLAGWATGFAPLKSLVPGLASTKAAGAVGFVVCGSALILRAAAGRSRERTRVARAVASIALVIGVFTVGEYLLGGSRWLDGLLSDLLVHARDGAHEGRMSFGTALCLALSAIALVALPRRAADWCAIAVAVVSFTVLNGYLYSAVSFHRLISYGSFPLPSALAFLMLSTGTLLADPERGLVRDLYLRGRSGTVLRKMVPAAVLIPMLLAWAAAEGERLGMYESSVGIGAMAAASIVAFIAVVWVTARSIEASEALRASAVEDQLESEADFRELFDSAPVGLAHSRPDGSFLAVNEALVKMLGYPGADALLRMNSAELYPLPADRDSVLGELDSLGHATREVQLRRADGVIIWVQMHVRAIMRAGGPQRFESAIIDLTERKRLEQQFAQAQKMEAVGRLAGGIAHDFNNMLTVIRSYCDLVVLETPENSPIRHDLGEIAGAADQAAALSRQLLAFSRKQVMLPQVFNPNAAVAEAHSMLRRVLPSAVKCELKLAPDLQMIRADPGSVNQVLMNLSINASDAMPEGGTLRISTSNCSINGGYAAAHSGVEPGEYVCLEVSDTGVGMDAETISRMYEPFFTTKPVGKGTGLGLATVYGIVVQNHGHLDVQSEPGKGTTFKVYFPRARVAADAATEREPVPAALHPRTSRVVLVVEDDDSVRASMERVLGREGYTVLSAPDGRQGMRVGQAHAGAIDLVISDVMMPEMGGRLFVEQLASVHPESRVLLISGYTDDDVLQKGQIDPSFAFLAKPFSVDQLVQKVERVLEAV